MKRAAIAAVLIGLVGGALGASAVVDYAPYVATGYAAAKAGHLSHMQVAAATKAQVLQYCNIDSNAGVPWPRGVEYAAVQQGIYRMCLADDANQVRADFAAGIDAFAASKGGGPYAIMGAALKEQIARCGSPAQLYPGDPQ